ncbi:Hsp70 family protein [Halobacteriovorax sp. JY17]|uniref:Hsp70 family protein n=1 Tax=Halobacteriovorax sp. JY17 TaxID=2014617 RepID=UPI000C38FF39|nr:Hsp70 family protein [Halobacteriovorax sp. JY17]PIK14663.1 MAG: hypothetical protein CES88_10005 [Halobacteriovorax sp. JY17]
MVEVLKYTLDFGTSNTLLGAITALGRVPSIPLDFKNINNPHVIKSLIYTPNEHEWYFGVECYDKYLEYEGEGRFFRSFKTLLSRESFEGTMIHGKRVGVVELVARYLREVRHRANSFYQQDVTRVVCGRPVRFGDSKKSDDVALSRLKEALRLAGFVDIEFTYEPVAAARSMKINLKSEAKVLVADLGAGTSDFSIINMKNGTFSPSDILSVSGVNVAGDSFDYSLMKNFILPEFGSRIKYKRPGSSVEHGISKTLIQQMSTPAIFSLINDSKIESYIEDAQDFVTNPQDLKRLENLESLFDSKLGFDLMKEVELAKIDLSKFMERELDYSKNGVIFKARIERGKYEESSKYVEDKVFEALEVALLKAELKDMEIDAIICTGGSVQNPNFLKLIKNKFGKEKVLLSNDQCDVVGGLN